MFKKSVKKVVDTSQVIVPDKVIWNEDGSIEIKKSYYYTHSIGKSPKMWAAAVRSELEANGLSVDVKGRDDYAEWPETSYSTAIVTER